MPPACRVEVLVAALMCWSHYDPTRLVYTPGFLLLSHFTGFYINCSDDKRRVKMIPRT